MARGNKTIKQRTSAELADPIYGNFLVGKLINRVMKDGKKTIAQKEVYRAFDTIKSKDQDPLNVFQEALKNIMPQMEVRSRRIGGAAYQVPTQVRGNRKTSLALRWLVGEAKARPTAEYRTFAEKLAAELLDAAKGEGGAVKKRELAQKMADANKAFSHFRW